MQKTNFKTRLLALLTAAFMLVMCVPFAAFAEGLSKDDTTKIHVSFQGYQTDDGDVYKRGPVTEITAPGDDSIDYWQVDGGVLTVKPGQTVSFGQLMTEIGTPVEEGTEKVAFVSFKAVKKAEVKSAKVSYYDESAEKQIAEIEMETYKSGNDVMVAATTVSEKCPAGYEVVNSDYIVRDGYVYVSVKKAEVKSAKVNYYDESAEKQIAEIEMETYKSGNDVMVAATTVSEKCPVGYEVVKSDYIVRDGYVYVSVKKASISKNVIFQVSQVEGAKWATKDDQNAYGQNSRTYTVWSDTTEKVTAPAAAKDGKDFDYWVCNYGDKKIVIRAGEEFNFDTLTAKGISATEAGDFAFNPVFKDKASSSSSSASSSASSSSNTTNTSASQKQVVKAAAAPANTTKVLPKTGASNVAPLLGGSLAVVALLMGYGVYGLVLRKKD